MLHEKKSVVSTPACGGEPGTSRSSDSPTAAGIFCPSKGSRIDCFVAIDTLMSSYNKFDGDPLGREPLATPGTQSLSDKYSIRPEQRALRKTKTLLSFASVHQFTMVFLVLGRCCKDRGRIFISPGNIMKFHPYWEKWASFSSRCDAGHYNHIER